MSDMEISYLGSMHRRGSPPQPLSRESWSYNDAAQGASLRVRGAACRLFTWDGLAILFRGYARPAGSTGDLDPGRIVEGLRCCYLERGELAVDGLEGGFTVALLDAAGGRAILYRNLIGAGFTYYRGQSNRLWFGSNLVDLVDAMGDAPRANEAALPTFFLYRCVPGRETLFDGVHRLLPGEQVEWDADGLRRRQRHTFASLIGASIDDKNALECLEETMGRVVGDCAAHQPQTANLLSGGVDSSYLQAVWNRRVCRPNEPPPSYSLSVDHPRSWPDADYAVTASQALGTRHRLIAADDPYADYLIETIAATGEPPNHVQSAYFGRLAQAMTAAGVAAGLCGEGADSLFGLGLAGRLHHAARLRCWLPSAALRSALGRTAQALGWREVGEGCQLANRLHDYTDLQHPVNRIASFADWEATAACFGADAVAAAAAARRALLDQYAVPVAPQDRLHAAGFLGEAMDSASLWTTLFHRAGGDLLCPFLDSRIVGLALNLSPEVRYRFRRPKDLLKQALRRYMPAALVDRDKLGFGQPIFEWLGMDGQLRPLVESIADHEWLTPRVRARVFQTPNWFLYSLLCYDVWRKLFIERSLPRPQRDESAIGSPAAPRQAAELLGMPQ
jgi:asparagine synthase (glutamine-hydrolysing)